MQATTTPECANPTCEQSLTRVTYSQTRSSNLKQNIAAVLQLPLSRDGEATVQTYDEGSGYARALTRIVSYKLQVGDYFFLQEPFGTQDQPNPVTATIKNFYNTESSTFKSVMYPANGTVEWLTGGNHTIDGPKELRKPMQVVWISVAVMILALAIVVFGFFVLRFLAEKQQDEARMPLYQQVGNKSSPVNVSQS